MRRTRRRRPRRRRRAATQSARQDLADVARHVTGCRLTQEPRFQSAFDDAAAISARPWCKDESHGHAHGAAATGAGEGHGHWGEPAAKKPRKKKHDLTGVSSVGILCEGELDFTAVNTFMMTLLQVGPGATVDTVAMLNGLVIHQTWDAVIWWPDQKVCATPVPLPSGERAEHLPLQGRAVLQGPGTGVSENNHSADV